MVPLRAVSRLLTLLCGLLLLAGLARAGDGAPVLLPLANGALALEEGQVSVLRDPAGTLTLAEVRQRAARGDFTPEFGVFSRGYTPEVYWLQLTLRNTGHGTIFWLELMPAFIDDVRLYEVLPDGAIREHRDGDHTRVAVQDSRAPTPLFRLDLPAGDTTLYLRLQTTSSMVAMLTLYEPPQLQRRLSTLGILYGIYFGLLGAIMLFNLLNWLLLRDRLFAIYVGYLGIQVVYFAAAYGISAQYLFPDHPAVSDRLVGVGLGGSLAAGALFYTRLLGISRRGAPVAWWGFMVAFAAGLLGISGALGGFYQPVAPLMQYAMLAMLLSSVGRVGRLMAHGTFEQSLAAVSFVLYMVPVLIGAAGFLGLVEASRNSVFAAQLANGVHLWLLHFVITRRVRDAELAREEFARDAAVARVEAEQARQRQREQSDLLAMITHEVRTPAAVIRSAMQSLQLVDPQPPVERATRYQRIDRSARRMGMLLELLAAGDRGQRVTPAQRLPVDLVALTREAVAQLDPEQETRVTLRASGGPLWVTGAPDQLLIALTNLLDNALKYSPAGSPVTVAVGHGDAPGVVSWVVDDRGPGIPVDARERVFQKYWRGGEGSGAPGLGLGLYIVREIVESVGGSVVCRDAPGGGARFLCTFPALAVPPTGEGEP